MERSTKAIIIMSICLIIFVSVGLFIGLEFNKMNKKGLSCIQEPINYANNEIRNQGKEDVLICGCHKPEDTRIDEVFNISPR